MPPDDGAGASCMVDAASAVGAIIATGATRAFGASTTAGSAFVLAALLVCAATTGVVSAVAETARTARTSGIIRLAFDIFVFMCRVLLTALQARGPPDFLQRARDTSRRPPLSALHRHQGQ